jgi:ubiquinone/menaquinone biosynthesis C-methylase UbiE
MSARKTGKETHISLNRDTSGKHRIQDEEVARHWDGNADLWTEHIRKGWDAYREYWNNPAFLKFIGNIKGQEILDAGCGEGYNTRILAQRGAKMTGIDISRKMIAHARRSEKQEPLGIRYKITSFADLSIFPDNSFDAVVSFMALMDGADYKGTLKEIYRVLRPNGKLYFSITHPCFMTTGFGWTGDKNDPGVKLTVAGYFSRKQWVEHWRFSQLPDSELVPLFAVPRFDRTLSDYINPLFKTGFVLKKIGEPRPTTETCHQHPFLKKWRATAALFLYIHAIKPQSRGR